MVLCFGRDLSPFIPSRKISLHEADEDLHTHSTHRMQIILKTRFQFPGSLGYEKCFVSKGYCNIQTYSPLLI